MKAKVYAQPHQIRPWLRKSELKRHVYARGVSSYSPLAHGSYDAQNRRNALRPTQREVVRSVIPALLRSINRPTDHEDVQGGALVAVGKAGAAKHIPMFQDVLWNRYRNPAGTRIKFGYQATESAVLALGLLPNLDQEMRFLDCRLAPCQYTDPRPIVRSPSFSS